MGAEKPLWVPSPKMIIEAPMTAFRLFCQERSGLDLPDHDALHAWSIDNRGTFWSAVWDFCEMRGHKGERELVNGDDMLAARFFPDALLNFAENLLSRKGTEPALIFRGENKARYSWSWDELHAMV